MQSDVALLQSLFTAQVCVASQDNRTVTFHTSQKKKRLCFSLVKPCLALLLHPWSVLATRHTGREETQLCGVDWESVCVHAVKTFTTSVSVSFWLPLTHLYSSPAATCCICCLSCQDLWLLSPQSFSIETLSTDNSVKVFQWLLNTEHLCHLVCRDEREFRELMRRHQPVISWKTDNNNLTCNLFHIM